MEPTEPHPNESTFYLDGPLHYLGLALPGVLDVTLVRTEMGLAALLFRTDKRARAHLGALPPEVDVQTVAGDDWRAKEELLLAARARGANVLWVDADAQGLEPTLHAPLENALNYVRSFKHQSACL